MISGLMGAARLAAGVLAAVMMPADPVPFERWIGENIVLVDGPHAGDLWQAENAPYLVAIAECLSDDHPSNVVTVRKAQQTGASILALAWAIYCAERTPGNMLYAAPSLDALRELNSQKLQPLIDAYEKHRGEALFFAQTSRSGSGSTTYEKRFPGGFLALANANSATDLSSKTVRRGVKDEVSKWQDIPSYGDPEALYKGRFTAFRRSGTWKVLEISTPEIDTGEADGSGAGHCRIDRSFKASDQRYWHVPCRECGEDFVQEWKLFHVDADDPDQSYMECPHCGGVHHEADRVAMVRAGRYVPTKPGRDRHPGFHIDAFMSLMVTYGEIARDNLEAEKGSEQAKKGFANLSLALAYQMRGDAPDHERLLERRERYRENRIPPDGLLLVAGCDVQHSGIWAEVIAFGQDRQSWGLSKRWLEGDTDVPGAGAWADLDALWREEFDDAWGRKRRLLAMAVDAGDGGRANQVYTFARSRENVFAIKGVPGWQAPAIGTPTKVDITLDGKKIKGGALLWPIGTWSLKSEFYGELRKKGKAAGEEADPPGYCHFSDFHDEGFFQQLTAEYLTTTVVGGRKVQKWAQSGPNHYLDCRVYAKAMADYLGLTRMTADDWAKVRKEYGAPPEAAPDLLSSDVQTIAATQPDEPQAIKLRGRGVRSRGIDT